MNKLLVVVPYKLWFCSKNTTRGLQIHALEIVIMVIQFIGCGVGGVLGGSNGCGLCPWEKLEPMCLRY
jgi:hypothetical protein